MCNLFDHCKDKIATYLRTGQYRNQDMNTLVKKRIVLTLLVLVFKNDRP